MSKFRSVSTPPSSFPTGEYSITIPLGSVKYFDRDGNETTPKEFGKRLFGDKPHVPNVTIETNGPVHIDELRRQIAIYDELTAEGAFDNLSPQQWNYAVQKRACIWNSLEQFAKEDGVPFDAEYRRNWFGGASA